MGRDGERDSHRGWVGLSGLGVGRGQHRRSVPLRHVVLARMGLLWRVLLVLPAHVRIIVTLLWLFKN